MDLQRQRDLLLLSEVERNSNLTQRSLSIRLGVALGLTNLYLKRLARKGYIKVTNIPRNRIQYLLTPQGFAEKSRLTYLYMQYSLSYYRNIRARLKDMLAAIPRANGRRIVIYGTTELAELAYLSLREMNFDVVGFIDSDRQESFLSHPVLGPEALVEWDFDTVLIADLENMKVCEERLHKLGLPQDKVLALRPGG